MIRRNVKAPDRGQDLWRPERLLRVFNIWENTDIVALARLLAMFAFALAGNTSAKAETVRGPAEVIDGATMVVAGKTVRLDNIVVPPLGAACAWNGRPFDCGKLARAGLMDITAGAQVTCTTARIDTYLCKADNFDLAFGLIHAGWAVPMAAAPAHYHRKMEEARSRKRALWGATHSDGTPSFALTLIR